MGERRPIRWRIAEGLEGRWGATIILALGALVLAAFIVPLMVRPFQGRPEIEPINQSEIRCLGSISEITREIPDGASPNNARRVCVEKARGRVLIGSVAGFFTILFTFIALMARAGKIQPKEVAR